MKRTDLLIELLERSVERMLEVDDFDVTDSFKYGWVNAEAKYSSKLIKEYMEDKEHEDTE